MNRENLFKGKREDNGEWETSHSVLMIDEWEYPLVSTYLLDSGLISINTDNIDVNITKVNANFYKIEPETVSQYTGLTDRYGKKLFEHDIIYAPQCSLYFRIEWYRYAWYAVRINCNYEPHKYTPLCELNSDNFEIVGNIFDNPELLGGDTGD